MMMMKNARSKRPPSFAGLLRKRAPSTEPLSRVVTLLLLSTIDITILPSESRIKFQKQEISEEAPEDYNQRHVEERTLQDGIVPVYDAVHDQVAYPGISEHGLDDHDGAEEARDRVAEERNNREEGVAKDISERYDALRHAARPSGKDVVALERLLRGPAEDEITLTKDDGGERQHGEYRMDQYGVVVVQPGPCVERHVPRDREQSQPHSEDPDQDHPYPERRRGPKHDRAEHRSELKFSSSFHRADACKCVTYREREEETRCHQDYCPDQSVCDQLGDRLGEELVRDSK